MSRLLVPISGTGPRWCACCHSPGTVVSAGRPVVIFGHSLGAAIAFEVSRELQRRGTPPRHLAVSAAIAVQVDRFDMAPEGLSDGDLIEKTRAAGRLPAEILDSPELLELVLPGNGCCATPRRHPAR